ncbi:hypothetical protein FQA47_024279 [Oryzias melastigma]|uniref:Uncharacterized protein n=1 Tax=Oryzias melastigma TaxID=30732 RepID=A0A834BZD3_ORYME|nr:hypothetical protein FQA47_024279 [Oryzias melastigma]
MQRSPEKNKCGKSLCSTSPCTQQLAPCTACHRDCTGQAALIPSRLQLRASIEEVQEIEGKRNTSEDFLCPMTADLLLNQNLRLPGRDGRHRRATLQKDEAMDALQQVQIRPRKTFSSLWGERGEESS